MAAADDADSYPGQQLGRPETGPRSVGRLGRRCLGLAVDWALALVIAHAFVRSAPADSFAPIGVLFVEHAVLVATAGGSLGHRIAGLRVETLHGGLPGLRRSVVRGVLLCLGLPPLTLLFDRDQRGLHDLVSGTVVVRR